MTEFQVLMKHICEASGGRLPQSTIDTMPMVLSEETQQRMIESGLPAEKMSKLIEGVTRVIEEGSIQTIEYLLNQVLDKELKM